MVASPRGPDLRVLTAFAVVVILLGMNFVAVRLSNRELAPFWAAGLRFALASAVLFAILGIRRIPMPQGPALRGAILFGLCAFFGVYAFAYWGLIAVPARMAAVIFATIPLTTLILAVAVGLERWRWLALAGAGVAVGGMAVVFSDSLGESVPPLSMLAILGGAILGALSGIILKKTPGSHPLSTNAVAMAVGTVLLLGISAASGEAWIAPPSGTAWAVTVWLVFSSVAAFALLVYVLMRWTASAASYQAVLTPLVTTVAGVVLLGEEVSVAFFLGGGLILVGVYIGTMRSRGGSPGPDPTSTRSGGS